MQISGSSHPLLPEHIAHLLRYVEPKESFRLRQVGQVWQQGGALAIAEVSCTLNGNSSVAKSLLQCVARLPALRRLDLRCSMNLEARDIGPLLEAATGVQEVDVTWAQRLGWQAYKELQDRFTAVRFVDVLTQSPSPNLKPHEVLFVQCYGLHAGRIDVCFAHASDANRAQTGPLSRFATLFEAPSPYAIMVHSDWFRLNPCEVDMFGEVGGASQAPVATCIVEFERQSRRRLFCWSLSLQQDGCWATDGVVEASWHDMMLADLEE